MTVKLQWLVMILAVSLTVGCGSSERRTAAPINNQQAIAEQEEEQVLPQDPDYYLQQAQRLDSQSANLFERNQWLLRAAEAYKQQSACTQSQKVMVLSLPHFENPVQRNHAKVLLAECELEQIPINQPSLAQLLQEIDPNISHRKRSGVLASELAALQNNWLKAAKALAAVFNGNGLESEKIWYYLQRLSNKALQQASLSEPELLPWLQLSLVVRDYGLNTPKFSVAVTQWQQQYPQHPLSLSLPQEVTLGMQVETLSSKKVAVLLPLSGRLAQQGLAIKEGALSAYFQQDSGRATDDIDELPVLHFFDTQVLNNQQLVEKVQEYDVVVGPLIKERLSEFVSAAPKSLNIIGLNRIDMPAQPVALDPVDSDIIDEQGANEDTLPLDLNLKPGLRVFFALSPEDEALQLAQAVMSTGASTPIVVSQDSGAARRMADTFMQAWQSMNPKAKPPALALFNDNKSMRDGLTAALDVKQSRDRIRQVENLTSLQVHSVPRNRRDVDAIVLFATPEQTELLNPIVEASLSPFNDKRVPVYASSRSFSENFSNNSLRDLRNITFTDMPWMLPDNQFADLKTEVETVFPERADTLKRLFALGFDAYAIIPQLGTLSALPQISVEGLTGSLSVDQQGLVMRRLPYGKITENEVISFALD